MVQGGEAASWTEVARFWVELPGGGPGRFYEVETSRAYRDRLVLKFAGLNDGNDAAQLRGGRVLVAESDAPGLQEGEYWAATLVGLRVIDESGADLGEVDDVIPTGGTDLLRVTPGSEGQPEERLIPMARAFVLEVDRDAGTIRVRLPEGLDSPEA